MANRYFFLTLVCFVSFPFYSIGQNLVDGVWKIKESKLLLPSDTLVPYRINQAINKLDLSKLSFDFSQDNTYIGTSYDETVISGTWLADLGVLTIDGKSGNFQFLNPNEFIVTVPFVMTDSTNVVSNATSILTFYNSSITSTKKLLIDEPFIVPTISENEIRIYGLPDNNEIFIQITNAFGQILYKNQYQSQSEITISTFGFPDGYYWVWVLYKNNTYYRKTLVLNK